MKVIITVNKYYPNFDGVQFVTEYLAEGLADLGNDIIVITSSYTRIPAPENEIYNKVRIVRLPIFTKHTIHHGDIREYQKVVLDECENADCIINVGTQSPFTDWCFEILDDIKCKKILYLHSIWDFNYHLFDFDSIKHTLGKIWANIRWRLYYRKNGYFFKKYDIVTQLHERDYSTLFFEKKYGIKSVIIENAAADEFFFDGKETFVKPFEKYIINVSNFVDRKNQIDTVKAFLNSNIDNNIGLVLIGSKDTEYLKKLKSVEKKMRNKKNIPTNCKPILYLTGVERKYISYYVRNSILYIMTSKWEAYPISIVESMAAGVPFISSDVGIVKYLPGGIISNKKEYSKKIEILLKDNELYERLSFEGNTAAKEKMFIKNKIMQLKQMIKEE